MTRMPPTLAHNAQNNYVLTVVRGMFFRPEVFDEGSDECWHVHDGKYNSTRAQLFRVNCQKEQARTCDEASYHRSFPTTTDRV